MRTQCLSDCFELRYTCYPPSVNLEKGGLNWHIDPRSLTNGRGSSVEGNRSRVRVKCRGSKSLVEDSA